MLSDSRAHDNASTAGQVKLTIGYSTEESRLFIVVHSCRSRLNLSFWFCRRTSCLEASVPMHSLVLGINLTISEPLRPAPRTAQTLTCPSSCCRTRKPPPRGEPPPRRGTWTPSSMRGEWSQESGADEGGRADVIEVTHLLLPPQVWLWFHPGGVHPEEAGPVGEEQRVLHEQRERAHRKGRRPQRLGFSQLLCGHIKY